MRLEFARRRPRLDSGSRTGHAGHRALDQFDALDREIKSAFTAVWTGRMDSDSFNQLTLSRRHSVAHRHGAARLLPLPAANRPAVQPGLHRAGAGQQSRASRAMLADLFVARFDPAHRRRGAPERPRAARISASAQSSRRSRVRTRTGSCARCGTRCRRPCAPTPISSTPTGRLKDYLSFKLESQKLRELPLPKPMFEIFVFSTAHGRRASAHGLRGARRHSLVGPARGFPHRGPRPDEGAAGQEHGDRAGRREGRIRRAGALPAEREAQQAEVIACYQTLIRGLARHHRQHRRGQDRRARRDVVRHDGDDAYLVVAADKGTATFSDIANAISEEYGFWLGDAFASGGSAGYDHKKMGITARGAWECVKRHFREIGIDIQSQNFTVAGIGDMSGDVFGNGMLQSRHIRLVAAFNHQHIFIDPQPDAARSFKERERLFKLPRSTWEDYSRAAISKGGGVYSRAAKSLTLSREAQTLLELPGAGDAERGHQGDTEVARRPVVERRHRHLRQG